MSAILCQIVACCFITNKSFPRCAPVFDFLVREKKEKFRSEHEFKRFVLNFAPWIIWTCGNCDLETIFNVLNDRVGTIERLKIEFGPLLLDEVNTMVYKNDNLQYINNEFLANRAQAKIRFLLNDMTFINASETQARATENTFNRHRVGQLSYTRRPRDNIEGDDFNCPCSPKRASLAAY